MLHGYLARVFVWLFLSPMLLLAFQQQTTTVIINNKPKPGAPVAGRVRTPRIKIPSQPSPVTYNKTVHIEERSPSDKAASETKKDDHGWYSPFATLIGAGLALLGTIYAFVAFPSRVKRLDLKLQYVQTQLKELYGPLLAECIRADSTFRRVELSLSTLDPTSSSKHRHHWSLRELRKAHFDASVEHNSAPDSEDRLRLFAQMLKDFHIESDNRLVNILKKNVHLFGPYPPISFFLFLTHAAQFEALLAIKQRVDLVTAQASFRDRFKDPYVISPFPPALTAEVIGKVSLLKALQQEYEYRISRISLWPFRTPGEIYFRDQYYLVMKDEREEMNESLMEHLHHPATSPLIWGPYTAIELFEIRAWLIFKELPLRDTHVLEDEHRFILNLLEADIVQSASKGSPKNSNHRPKHYRVAQAFDEIGPISKTLSKWYKDFRWEDMLTNDFGDLWFTPSLSKLKDLPESGENFAYRKRRFNRLHGEKGFIRTTWSRTVRIIRPNAGPQIRATPSR